MSFSIISCKEKENVIDFNQLQNKDEVFYKKDDQMPFTGLARAYYDNGKIKSEVNYKDAVQDG